MGLALPKRVGRLGSKTKLIFLSFHKNEDIFREALDLGGKGYLLKDSAMQEIVTAVHAVIDGQVYMSSAIALQLLNSSDAATASG